VLGVSGVAFFLFTTFKRKQHVKGKEKEKEKERKRKKKKGNLSIANRIAKLLYSTFERVPVVFYHATPC